MDEVRFTWAVMTPSDFALFRLAEFEEDRIEEMNPARTWVVYVEAQNSAGECITSSTVATDELKRPTDREAYAWAKLAVSSLLDYCRDEGYGVSVNPPIVKGQVPAEYRA